MLPAGGLLNTAIRPSTRRDTFRRRESRARTEIAVAGKLLPATSTTSATSDVGGDDDGRETERVSGFSPCARSACDVRGESSRLNVR